MTIGIEALNKLDKREKHEDIRDPSKVKMGEGTATAVVQYEEAVREGVISGIGCTKMIDATPTFNKAECELEIKHDNINAGIVFGRDRPGDKLSGYGGVGTKRSSAIDIVVGRLGPEATTVNERNELIYCENNFTMDAARIYISQRTNIDQNFKIRRDTSTISPGIDSAGIGIKADCIRIIGRSDVKIVTGTDTYDAHGRKVGVESLASQKIALIGANRADLLQPMVKGENLKAFLNQLIEYVNSLADTLSSMSLYQNQINLAVMNHTHRDKLNVNTFGFPSENLFFPLYSPNLKLTTEVKASIVEINSALEVLKVKYLEAPSTQFADNENILSSFNFCN